MKKFGFTLSEILVTIAVIGVISSIVVPMVGDILPDQDKMKVLKCYKTIVDTNNELLNDPSLYWTPDDEDCLGFGCVQKPIDPKYKDNNNIFGVNKYLLLFADKLENDVDSSLFPSKSGVKFNTPDGLYWTLTAASNGEYNMTIDLNGSEGPNASYSTTQKPDIFTFKVSESGKVSGNDNLTKAYLKNPHKLNDKKKDYEAAKNME